MTMTVQHALSVNYFNEDYGNYMVQTRGRVFPFLFVNLALLPLYPVPLCLQQKLPHGSLLDIIEFVLRVTR